MTRHTWPFTPTFRCEATTGQSLAMVAAEEEAMLRRRRRKRRRRRRRRSKKRRRRRRMKRSERETWPTNPKVRNSPSALPRIGISLSLPKI